MGGKALGHLGIATQRKSTADFNRIFGEVSQKLQPYLSEMHQVKCFHTKETHGDLDILFKVDHVFYNKGINPRKLVEQLFETKGIHTNGSVLSFEYDNFQVDLIPVAEKNWEVAKGFFDYDPSANAMGKVAHRFGLKYGFQGLVYPFRNFNGRNSHNLTVSLDNRKIFEFLGYDYDRYLQGFETMEDIFDFIISGKYFNSQAFQMENLRHIDRKRNKKRASYQEFLKYIQEKNITDYQFRHKSEYVDFVDAAFPEANLKTQLAELEQRDKENQQMAEKFNGHLIMAELPNLKGKELGDAITKFKAQFEDFRSYALSNSSEKIMSDFKEFYG